MRWPDNDDSLVSIILKGKKQQKHTLRFLFLYCPFFIDFYFFIVLQAFADKTVEFNEEDEDDFDEEEESKFCTLPRSNNGFTIRHVSAFFQFSTYSHSIQNITYINAELHLLESIPLKLTRKLHWCPWRTRNSI